MPFLSGFELYSRWVPLAYHFSVPALMIFTRVFLNFSIFLKFSPSGPPFQICIVYHVYLNKV